MTNIDKSKNSKSPPSAYSKIDQNMSNSAFVLDDIVALRDAHDVWYNGTYKASNDELYKLLANCLEIYQRMTKQRLQIAMFDVECTNRGFKFKKTTSLLYRIVKYVFCIDNKRVSRYALALTVAQAEAVDPMDLHIWIANNGGIEEIHAKKTGRVSKAARAKSDKSTGLVAAQTASAQQMYTPPAGFSIRNDQSPFVAVLARVNDAGVIELIAPIADVHAVDAVLAAYGAAVTIDSAAKDFVSTVNAQNDATFEALNS